MFKLEIEAFQAQLELKVKLFHAHNVLFELEHIPNRLKIQLFRAVCTWKSLNLELEHSYWFNVTC